MAQMGKAWMEKKRPGIQRISTVAVQFLNMEMLSTRMKEPIYIYIYIIIIYIYIYLFI